MGANTPLKRCVISAAFGSNKYRKRFRRLKRSLSTVGFQEDVLGWEDTPPQGTPTHFESPYAFKAYGFMEARARGYDLVLWVDASCVFVRNPDILFEKVRKQGILLYRNRDYILGEWCSDLVLDRFGVSRDEALKLPEALGTVLGLDMNDRDAGDFLDEWYRKANDGYSFRGTEKPILTWDDFRDVKWNTGGCVSSHPRVQGHRHDQSIMGLLARQMGLRLEPGEEFGYNVEPANLSGETVFVVMWRWRKIRGNIRSVKALTGAFLLLKALLTNSRFAYRLRRLSTE